MLRSGPNFVKYISKQFPKFKAPIETQQEDSIHNLHTSKDPLVVSESNTQTAGISIAHPHQNATVRSMFLGNQNCRVVDIVLGRFRRDSRARAQRRLTQQPKNFVRLYDVPRELFSSACTQVSSFSSIYWTILRRVRQDRPFS